MDAIDHLWHHGQQKTQIFDEVCRLYADFGHVDTAALYCTKYFVMRGRDRDLAISATRESFQKFWMPELLTLLCQAYAKSGKDEEALKLTQKYLFHPKLMGSAMLCRGCLLLRKTGQFDGSVDLFVKAAKFGGLRADLSPAGFAIPNKEFEALGHVEDDPARPPIEFLAPPPPATKAVVAASCDEKYLRLFGGVYADSFFKHNPDPGHTLHLHIFDPSDALVEELRTDKGPFADRTAYSFEQTSKMNRAYYYAGRFLQVPRLMKRYECSIVLTDIDCAFKRDITELLRACEQADLGIVDTKRSIFPWRNHLANTIVFGPTAVAYRQAMSIRNYLLRGDVRTFNYYYVDQLAIVQAAYAQRNLGIGEMVMIRKPQQKLCHQGSGLSKRPDEKAERMRRSLVKKGELEAEEVEEADAD